VAEFQIAVSICCHSTIRFIDHLGENMVTHGKSINFMVFNNLAFFYPVWLFFGHVFFSRCLATLGGFAMHGLQSWIANCTAKEAVQKQNCKPQSSYNIIPQ